MADHHRIAVIADMVSKVESGIGCSTVPAGTGRGESHDVVRRRPVMPDKNDVAHAESSRSRTSSKAMISSGSGHSKRSSSPDSG